MMSHFSARNFANIQCLDRLDRKYAQQSQRIRAHVLLQSGLYFEFFQRAALRPLCASHFVEVLFGAIELGWYGVFTSDTATQKHFLERPSTLLNIPPEFCGVRLPSMGCSH